MSTAYDQHRAETWLIVFDDVAMSPEFFTDEAAARARLAALQLNWNCALFASAGVVESMAARVKELEAAVKDRKCLECYDTGFATPSGLVCGFCRSGAVAESRIRIAELEAHVWRAKDLEHLLTALGCQFAGVDIAIEVVEAKDKRIAELEADGEQ